MAIICERCGTRTSSMICTECGYINPDPNDVSSNSPDEKKDEAISFDSASKLVRNWRWTNVFGYLHTIAIALFWIGIAVLGLVTAGILIMIVVVSAFVKPENRPVLYGLFGIDASISGGGIFVYLVLPILIAAIIMYCIWGIFGMSMARNIACIGLSLFLKKKKISLRASFGGEDLSRSGMMLQDAMVMKDRPLCILAFFGRTIGSYLFIPVVGASLSVAVYYIFNAIQLLQDPSEPSLLTPIILIASFVVVAIIFAIPFFILKKVMETVFENKIYKQ